MSASTPDTTPDATCDEPKDRSTAASEEGFTGTLAGFIEWLKDSLCYGHVQVSEAVCRYRSGAKVMRVETVTGGYSSDERLLGRAGRHYLMASAWQSSHVGGLTVYEFPMRDFMSPEVHEFLVPEDGVFEHFHRVRHIHVYREDGSRIELSSEAGVELVYQEPERDIFAPDALLILRPISEPLVIDRPGR